VQLRRVVARLSRPSPTLSRSPDERAKKGPSGTGRKRATTRSQLHHTSGITALPDHLVDCRGGTQPGILLYSLPEELYVGSVTKGRRALARLNCSVVQRMADGVWVAHRVPCGLVPNFPMFGVEPDGSVRAVSLLSMLTSGKIRGTFHETSEAAAEDTAK